MDKSRYDIPQLSSMNLKTNFYFWQTPVHLPPIIPNQSPPVQQWTVAGVYLLPDFSPCNQLRSPTWWGRQGEPGRLINFTQTKYQNIRTTQQLGQLLHWWDRQRRKTRNIWSQQCHQLGRSLQAAQHCARNLATWFVNLTLIISVIILNPPPRC